MATKKKTKDSSNEVKVVKGSHLTVTTYPDGRTELEWDHEALQRDVDLAIKSLENKQTEEKPKRKRATKK